VKNKWDLATLNQSARRITSELNGLRVAVMPFARVGRRGLSHGKSHAGPLSPFCFAGGASAMLAAHSSVIRTELSFAISHLVQPSVKHEQEQIVAKIKSQKAGVPPACNERTELQYHLLIP
jgi:hypothetical protein